MLSRKIPLDTANQIVHNASISWLSHSSSKLFEAEPSQKHNGKILETSFYVISIFQQKEIWRERNKRVECGSENTPHDFSILDEPTPVLLTDLTNEEWSLEFQFVPFFFKFINPSLSAIAFSSLNILKIKTYDDCHRNILIRSMTPIPNVFVSYCLLYKSKLIPFKFFFLFGGLHKLHKGICSKMISSRIEYLILLIEPFISGQT